jgi:hypothetical protein
MIHRSLLLLSMFSCAFAWGCSGRIDLGTGSPDSGAAAEGGVPFEDASLDRARDAALPPSEETCDDNGIAHAKGTTWQCACNTCSCISPPSIATTTAFCFDAGDEVDESADSSGGGGTCPSISIHVDVVVPRFPDTNADDNPNHTFPSRPQNLDPTGIDYNDCSSNIHLQFTGSVDGLPCTDTMQIWAGTTDCTPTSARQTNSGAAHCWPGTSTVALQTAFTLNIRAQDLVAFLDNAKPPTAYTPQGATACKPLDTPRCEGFVSLNLYFMAIEADGLTMDGTPALYSLDAIVGSPDGGLCRP